jgi:hypothetical protein
MPAELTYKQLQKAVAELGKTITRDGEAIRGHAKTIDDEAKGTSRIAEQIGALRVDSSTVAETRELSKVMGGVSEAAIAYASAGDNTARAAHAAQEQNRSSHDGINEAVSRSNVSGIHDVDREWLRQE